MTAKRADPGAELLDEGLVALCGIAAYFRVPTDVGYLNRELALGARSAQPEDLVRAAKLIGLKARIAEKMTAQGLLEIPFPAILQMKDGRYCVLAGRSAIGVCRIIDPITRIFTEYANTELASEIEPLAILVTRRLNGPGTDPKRFGLAWFLPSIWRYRRPIAHVVLASLFVQIFALVTPLFFQVIIDKVLTHHVYSTLTVLIVGLFALGLFDVVLQYLRSYALAHSTNRLDVELGSRLFRHMMRLPVSYFETRPAGQTVARVRELENIRNFLTGQALFSGLDLIFAGLFIALLFGYSPFLSLVVLATIPVYVLIGLVLRPVLRNVIKEKFSRGAASQQFLVESVVGMPTIKGCAAEPFMQVQWEDRLAAHLSTAFDATMLSAIGQNAIQYTSKATTALILLFGAQAVMNGELTVGALVAFNMITGQAIAPILRLSQLWQDFQQVQISIERIGDILNFPAEAQSNTTFRPPRPRGAIEFRRVSFRYRQGGADVLKEITLKVKPGEVIGIVGPSGSGKSTLTKLVQRLYQPTEGSILIDGHDLTNVDPAWLRSNIGVVMQENILFNRSIHDNIALAMPSLHRAQVMDIARLTGAHDFICRLPEGYDTIIEERGANLSGGQRQRIAIARALAANPAMLIFDEATSALDYESERIIQANMADIVRGRTVLIIAHRLAAVRACHRIVGIADGRIIEVGTHDELSVRRGGLYAHLLRLQNDTRAMAEAV